MSEPYSPHLLYGVLLLLWACLVVAILLNQYVELTRHE